MNNSKNFSNDSLYVCPFSTFYIVQAEFLIQSILMDLIAGIILSALIYQFYRGIEISHPVYSILYSNIVFSLVSSFISFCGAVYPYIGGQSCAVFLLLNRYNISSNVVVNIVSWTTISVLRYHLLITAKIKNKSNELNLPRIRNISLISDWAIIIVVLTLWIILKISNLTGWIPYSKSVMVLLQFIIMAILMLFSATTFAVYYKMELKLKEEQQSKEGKIQYDLQKRKNSGKSIFLVFLGLNISKMSSRNRKKVTNGQQLKFNSYFEFHKTFQFLL